MSGDLIGVALAAVAVLVGAVLLVNELVLWFRGHDEAPRLRDRMQHGRHARGWVHVGSAWRAARAFLVLPIDNYQESRRTRG